MVDESTQPGGDWSWLAGDQCPVMGCLIFARGVTLDRVVEAFGLDAGSALLVPQNRLHDALPFPVYDDGSGATSPYVRVGQTGEWAFAMDEQMLSAWLDLTQGNNLGRRLSAGADAVVVSWTPKPTEVFEYWEDSSLVTRFEPYMAWYRDGRDPDRFLRQMRQVGLKTERPGESDSPKRQEPEYVVAALEIVSLALGIRLPEEVIRGPLLTVQCSPGEYW